MLLPVLLVRGHYTEYDGHVGVEDSRLTFMRSRGRGMATRQWLGTWKFRWGICEYANDVKLVYTWFGNRRSEGEVGLKMQQESKIFVVARMKGVSRH